MITKTRAAYAATLTAVLVVVTGGAAFAAATPPEPATVASNILAGLAQKLVDTVTAMATNTWVLALFGIGIAFGVVARVLAKAKGKSPV